MPSTRPFSAGLARRASEARRSSRRGLSKSSEPADRPRGWFFRFQGTRTRREPSSSLTTESNFAMWTTAPPSRAHTERLGSPRSPRLGRHLASFSLRLFPAGGPSSRATVTASGKWLTATPSADCSGVTARPISPLFCSKPWRLLKSQGQQRPVGVGRRSSPRTRCAQSYEALYRELIDA